MKLLKTKTAVYMLAEGLTKVTIWPVLKLTDMVSGRYTDTKAKLEINWIKKNLDNMTAQEKFDATVQYRSELAWVNDPIIESSTTVLHAVRNGQDKSLIQRFEIAYSFLRSSGVEKFTPAVDAYYMLNINKVTV